MARNPTANQHSPDTSDLLVQFDRSTMVADIFNLSKPHKLLTKPLEEAREELLHGAERDY